MLNIFAFTFLIKIMYLFRRNNCILLDCGEGTCAQIHRIYGNMSKHIFHKIKAVFVSHLHIDHYGGLVELIRMRKHYLPKNREPLMLLCSKDDLKSWLLFYDNTVEAIHDDMVFINNENLVSTSKKKTV